jgi:signal transduction histidine kinase
MGTGVIIQLVSFGVLYPAVGLRTHPGSLPAPDVVSAILQPVFPLLIVSIVVMLLVYPVGTPPSPRWRPVLWVAIAGAAMSYLGLAVVPESVNPIGGLSFPNPLAIRSFHGAISTGLVVVAWVTFLAGVGCLSGLVVRFRRGNAELRQQVKWLAFAAGGAVACSLLNIAALVACNCDESGLSSVAVVGSFLFIIVAVPASIAVAVLKYRLYEIDVIIGKAVLYGLLAAFFTVVYVAIVIGVGAVLGSRGNSFLTIVAAVVIAVAFQPVRERARRLANRAVYGRRATPYEVLSEFSGRAGGAYAADDVLPRMAQVLAAGTGAEAAAVWLRVGGELRPAAVWPGGASAPSDDHVEVSHHGERLGELSVRMPANDPMNPGKAKLVEDLAAQAGLVLRNVRLIEELRASRQRLVAAQDEERRKIERNIHDGAQQQLVALAVKQRMVASVVGRDNDRARAILEELQSETTQALEDLRDLARGVYPPLLADQGLAAALEAQGRKSAVPVDVMADGVGRFPQEIEAAVYFSCLEALQNVAKYAEASGAVIRLANVSGELTFEVEDDGVGFDASSTGYGTGLQGMADRLDALGGRIDVRSARGSGTTITGVVPVAATSATP